MTSSIKHQSQFYFKHPEKAFISESKYQADLKNEMQTDLFASVKYLLIVGKLISLVPCDKFSWKSVDDFNLRKNSTPSVLTMFLILWSFVKDIVGLKFLLQVSHGGVVGYMHPAHYFLISSIVTFIYVYFFINFNKLKTLFIKWELTAANFSLNVFETRKVTICAVSTIILPFFINALFVIDSIYHFTTPEPVLPPNITSMEYAYGKLMRQWHAFVPFSKLFAVICSVDFIWNSFPRSFVLSFVSVFSYAISRQFKDLVEKTKVGSDGNPQDQNFWLKVVKKHNALTELVAQFDAFLSPLIFITYLTSLYLICMQLLRALSLSMNGETDIGLTLGLSPFIYNASFFVEVFLLYFMSISAAQLNYYAHEIGNVLRDCPTKYLDPEVTRLENRVNSGPRIGFTGLGCFVITKPFLLTFANAVLTLEIILLQAQFQQPVSGLE